MDDQFVRDEFAKYFTFIKNLPINNVIKFLIVHKDIEKYCSDKLLEIPEYQKVEFVLYSIIKNRPIKQCYQCKKYVLYAPGKKLKNCNMHFCSHECMGKNNEFKKYRLKKSYDSAGGINPFASPEKKEKIKQTLLKRYGVDNPLKLELFKQHSKDTCLKKYGVDNVYKSDYFTQKSAATNILRYGSRDWNIAEAWKTICNLKNVIPLFTKDEYTIRTKIYNWQCKHCNSIFSLPYCGKLLEQKCICQQKHTKSYDEKYIIKFLRKYTKNKLDILVGNRKIICPYELDIVIPSKKIAIEYNGIYWHSTNNEMTPKDKFYHLNKTNMCEKLGYQLIHIWENDWLENRKLILRKLIDIIENKNIDYDKLVVNNRLILDRCWFSKRDIADYKLIRVSRPKLINENMALPYWNSGYLIYEKIRNK